MIKTLKIFTIPKNKYENRTIYAPFGEYRKKLKSLSTVLTELSHEYDTCNTAYGFMPGRNSVMNALVHKHKQYILSFDLENFFDYITSEMLNGILSKEQISLCFVDNIAKQGLSTSPAISNLAFAKIDYKIMQFLKKTFTSYKYSSDSGMEVPSGILCSYSRYADDLTFGFNNIDDFKIIKENIIAILSEHGFKINVKKTKLQNINNGRVIITGIAMDFNGFTYPTRKMKRKLRSAFHHYQYHNSLLIKGNKQVYLKHVIRGLRESMKNKLPNERWIKKIYDKLDLQENFSLFEFTKLVKSVKNKHYPKNYGKYTVDLKEYVAVDSIFKMNNKTITIENNKKVTILYEFDSKKLACLEFSKMIDYKSRLHNDY